jgi:hypothetical protein
MTLSKDGLKDSLSALFAGTVASGGYPTTDAAAGKRWGDLYAAYAKDAKAPPTEPPVDEVNTAGGALATALATAFSAARVAVPPHYPTLVASMVAAFTVFWLPIHFASATPPATGQAASPAGTLTTELTNFFEAGPSSDAAAQAESLAAILHKWTKSVTVINTINGVAQPAVNLQ